MSLGNGEIDYEEFKSIVSNNLLTQEDDVKETFCVFDRDESGFIGIEEISLMFSRLGHDLRLDYIEAVTDAADIDRDGIITFRGLLCHPRQCYHNSLIKLLIFYRRSIAERGGCFQQNLFVCLFVCMCVCLSTQYLLND